MAEIKKKCWPGEFERVVKGEKRLELRLNDFEAHEGDTLILQEYNPQKQAYTGREVRKKITAVMRFKLEDIPYWSPADIKEKGLQMFSLE